MIAEEVVDAIEASGGVRALWRACERRVKARAGKGCVLYVAEAPSGMPAGRSSSDDVRSVANFVDVSAYSFRTALEKARETPTKIRISKKN